MTSPRHDTILRRMGRLIAMLFCWLCLTGSAAQAREIRVGLYENEPKLFTDPHGNPAGIFVDLLQAVAEQEGWQPVYVSCVWEECLRRLASGELDLMPDVALSTERQRLFDFHATPALRSWSQFYQPIGGTLESVPDLHQRRVAVLDGSIQQGGLTQLEQDYGIHLQRVSVANWHSAMEAVRTHQADVVVTNHFFGDYHAAEFGLEATPIIFQPVHLYFAAPKGKPPDLLHALDQHLSAWQRDEHSPYFSILTKWNPHEPPFHRWLGQALLFLALLLLLSLLIAFLLRKRLHRQTARLQETTERLRATLDALPDLMFEVDGEGCFLDYHSPHTELLSVPATAFIGKRMEEVLPPDVAAIGMAALREAEASGSSHGKQYPLQLPDGQHWFELSVARKSDPQGGRPHFILLSRDISDRKQAEMQMERVRKLYAALSECNQSIVRCANEAELLPIVCRIAVEFGGMKMAWIGMAHDGLIRPVASYGSGTEYLAGFAIPIDADQAAGRGPSATAFREHRPYWCQDFQHDAATLPWHERGAQYGWGASAALPLTCKDKVVGVFNLYAAEPHAFVEDVRNLLQEMAMDISHALGRFADEQEREAISARLRESEERYHTAFRTSPDAININRLHDGLYLDVNHGFEQLTGWQHHEVVGKTSAEINIWHDLNDCQRLLDALQRDGQCSNFQADFNSRDGRVIAGLMSATLITLQGERCILWIR